MNLTRLSVIMSWIVVIVFSIVLGAIMIEMATGLPARRAIEGWIR